MVTNRNYDNFKIQSALLQAQQLARDATISVASRNDEGALESIIAAIAALWLAHDELKGVNESANLPS